MSESGDGCTIAESAKEQIRSRRPTEMEIASGRRERTHKDKALIFNEIGRVHRERSHSEYHLCYQFVCSDFEPDFGEF